MKLLKKMLKISLVGLLLIVGLPIGVYYSFGEDGLLDYVERFGSGFDTIKEYRQAEEAGFTDKDKYEADLKKKAERLAEQKRKKEELAKEKERLVELEKQKLKSYFLNVDTALKFLEKGLWHNGKKVEKCIDGAPDGGSTVATKYSDDQLAFKNFIADNNKYKDLIQEEAPVPITYSVSDPGTLVMTIKTPVCDVRKSIVVNSENSIRTVNQKYYSCPKRAVEAWEGFAKVAYRCKGSVQREIKTKDDKTAMQRFTLAAKQGNASAQHEIKTKVVSWPSQREVNGWRSCNQHPVYKGTDLKNGLLKTIERVASANKFRFSFNVGNNLYCTYKGSVLSLTPVPRNMKYNTQYIEYDLGSAKGCVLVLAADLKIKNQGALNIIFNHNKQVFKKNPGFVGWGAYCS